MGRSITNRDSAALIEGIRQEAVAAHAVPASIAGAAAEIALRKFGAVASLDDRGARRVRDYFWGVVRRRALIAGRETAALRQRYVAATVAADMLEAGHALEHVRDAVETRFGAGITRAPLDAA